MKRHVLAFIGGLAILSLCGLIYTNSQAAGPVVTNLNDAGPGSLRQAVADVAPGDTITFASGLSGQTIALTSGEFQIGKNLTIQGPAGGITISGGDTQRIVHTILNPTVNLRDLTITHGYADGPGAALAVEGTLNLERVTVEHSSATSYGGGAWVRSNGIMNVSNSTFRLNDATNGGGGIFAFGGLAPDQTGAVISISGSTLNNNTSAGPGGGLYVDIGEALDQNGGPVTIVNSTISGNTATDGSGVYVAPAVTGAGAGSATLKFVTIANNTSTAGVALRGPNATLTATIVAKQAQGANCGGTIVSNGYNLEDANSCGFGQVTDHPNATLTLGPLLVNPPGTTATHALVSGDAVDKIPLDGGGCGTAFPSDQRGIHRPSNSSCDIGSYEIGTAIACSTPTPTPSVSPIGPTPRATRTPAGTVRTNTPTPTATATPTPTVSPVPTPCATPEPLGIPIDTPSPSPTPVPATPTPTGGPTPRPTRTPHG